MYKKWEESNYAKSNRSNNASVIRVENNETSLNEQGIFIDGTHVLAVG